MKKYFLNKEFEFIFHFAAQAGVRYSMINPRKYIKVNKEGFENIINNLNNIKSLKKVFYASSSSVYGSRKKFPSSENLKLFPQSIYAKTKLQNEIFARKISKKISYDLIGLRFCTVYGEWGRPDMFIFKILNAHMNKKNFYLNNFGNHERDFTYIKDIVILLEKFLKREKFKHKIFNICSSRPINIRTLCLYLKKKLNIKKIIEVKKNNYDVNKTHGDNKLIKQYFKIRRFTKFQTGLNNTVEWYLKSNIYKL